MQVLFITRTLPYPAYAGDLQVTAALLQAMSEHPNMDVTVFCGNGRRNEVPQDSVCRWEFGTAKISWHQDLGSLLTKLPRAASRSLSGHDVARIGTLLSQYDFDIVILNECSTARAIPLRKTFQTGRSSPQWVYFAHNVESVIRPQIANAAGLLAKPLMRLDAKKYRHAETQLLNSCDAYCAISEHDLAHFRRIAPVSTPGLLLKPGYDGPRAERQTILPQTPRRATLVGSFHWNAKRANLHELLAAYQRYCRHAIEPFALRIAGSMPPRELQRLSRSYPQVEFVGEFDDIRDVLTDTRVALVLEKLGGGFKLKTLDYIFNRTPILAYPSAMRGTGLQPREHYLAAADIDQAMRLADQAISDLTTLNQLQRRAYEHSDGRFEWSNRANLLYEFASRARRSGGVLQPS